MLRITPLLLSHSRRRAVVSGPPTLPNTLFTSHTSLVTPTRPAATSTASPGRFLSSNNAGGGDGGDVAVKSRPSILQGFNNDKGDGDAFDSTSSSLEEEKVDRVQELYRQRVSRGGGGEGQTQQRSNNGQRRSNNDNGNDNTRWQERKQYTGNDNNSNNNNNNNNRKGGQYQQRDNDPQSNRYNNNRRPQTQGNHPRGKNSGRPDERAQKQPQSRLQTLMEDLKRSASKPMSPPPASTPSPSASERLPPIPSLRQRFLKKDDESTDALPPLNMDRQFRIRPATNQSHNANGFGNETAAGTTGSSSNPGYRMPRRRQEGRGRTNNGNDYNAPQQNYQRPVFRDSMDFLEARRIPQEETSDDKPSSESAEETTRTVTLPGSGIGLDLTQTSALYRVKVEDIQRNLKSMGFSREEVNDKSMILDTDTLELLALEYGIETVRGQDGVVVDAEELLMQQRRADDAVAFPPRPPVVTIMGHVDHGKTTLLDALRRRAAQQHDPTPEKKKKKKKDSGSSTSADVAGTEAGGITQVVSAFQVDVEGQDNKVTFLDTPGHAAFKAMRQSGSHAADVIVLVVAADDGVSEQTLEILEFYKSIAKGSSGGISMVVALNKIDKPGIDVDEAKIRIENQLLEQGILCEGMRGDSEYGPPVQVIPTSGLTGEGLDDLMDGLILQSEVMDLRADHEAHAEGIVMDARMEKGLGVVADCIIRWGCIEKGDVIVSGSQAARVRILKDVNDKMLKQGLPSQPVRIVGFKSLPKAGDPIMCVESEEIAEEMVEQLATVNNEEEPVDRPRNPNEVELHINGVRARDTRRVARFHQLAAIEEDDGTIRIPIVVKAGADGSLSAVRDSLVSLGTNSKHKVVVDPIQEGIGEITPTDIQMAKESDACIFAFGLKRIDQAVLNLAEAEGVTIRSNDIIYSLLDDAKKTLGRYLPPQPFEKSHGRASIQAIFIVDGESGEEKVAGLKVLDGNLYRAKNAENIKCHFRVHREGTQISPKGQTVGAHSLRRFKELVESVRHGEECGLVLTGFDEFQEGDEIECYSVEMKTSTLD